MFLFKHSDKLIHLSLLIIRLGIGFSFIMHGYSKMFGGVEKWEKLGNNMALLGITFLPVFWGMMAAISEFFGGIFIALGLGTRIFSILMSFTMLVAMLRHISAGDSFGKISHPFEMLVIFIALIIAGGGKYAIDSIFNREDNI